MNQDGENQFLTVEDVAKRFCVDMTTIYRLAQKGKLPAIKIGSQWRFHQSSLKNWIKQQESRRKEFRP